MMFFLHPIIFCVVLFIFSGFSASAETLNFNDIKQNVLANNPGLSAAKDLLKAAEAEMIQAGEFPNSELDISLEDFGQNSIEVILTQPIEIGGKRKARREVTRNRIRAVVLERDIMLLELETELIRRCVIILSLQKKIEVLDSLASVMEENLNNIQRRRKAGAAMEADELRMEMEIYERAMEKESFQRQLSRLKKQLAVLWGKTGGTDINLSCTLMADIILPDMMEIQKKIYEHPEIKLSELIKEAAVLESLQLKADAFPEMSLSGGYLRNSEADENAVITGFSIALPFFNRNKGAILSKKHETAALGKTVQMLYKERVAESETLLSEIENTMEIYRVLTKKLQPKAENVYALIERYYKLGNISIIEVLDSRRTLLEINLRCIDLTTEHSLLAADLMELTGIPIQIIQ